MSLKKPAKDQPEKFEFNSSSLEDLLRKIQSWPGVQRTETQIVLSDYKMIQKITDLTTI